MARIRVQTEDFDIGAEFAALSAGRTDIGGIGCFVGTVRNNAPNQRVVDQGVAAQPVIAMTLEHYPAMTERAIARITAEAERRWALLGCTVIHRVGRLAAGDNIVLVLAAAAHRQPALDATAFLIDWLKTKAPFWKREEFAVGGAAWVEARADDDAAASRW
jgi:molybdopterin synthase catalytic subunit